MAAETAALLKKLDARLKARDWQQAEELLVDAKLEVVQFRLLPPFPDPKVAKIQLSLARDVFEKGALLSVEKQDFEGFQRHIAEVRPFYLDYGSLLDPSENQWPLTGLHLLGLLANNDLGSFHAEVELIPFENLNNPMIRYALDLEQHMVAGMYSKVLVKARTPPSARFSKFAAQLEDTVRAKIADCLESAYGPLKISEAQHLLKLESPAAIQSFIREREWEVAGDTIEFGKKHDGGKEQLDLAAHKLMAESLDYAHELHRIV